MGVAHKVHFWYTFRMTVATKQRIQVSLSPEAERLVPALARRRRMPTATLASALIDTALELEEDRMLSLIADERFSSDKIRWMSHDTIWKKHLGKSYTIQK